MAGFTNLFAPWRAALCPLALIVASLPSASAQSGLFLNGESDPLGGNSGITTSIASPSTPASSLKTPSVLFTKDPVHENLTQAQRAVREADRHFQYGKFCIQEGRLDDARREFDLSINALMGQPQDLPDRASIDRKFEELVRLINRYDLDNLGAGVSQDSPLYTQAPVDQLLDLTFPVDPRMKDKVRAQVQAGGSQLPLTVNDAVLSYINYFVSERGRKTVYFGLRRGGRYQEMISRVLTEEGVPQEMFHLAQAESGFMPLALSRKAAAGMWQFLRSRGNEYGLQTTAENDERLDPEKATRAAARHLRDLHNQLGDWYLAMAAYNCGPYCVERAVQRTGYADFWELRRRNALPKETRNYVPAILALAIVSHNLESYGLPPAEQEAPLQFESLRMTSRTNLALIADAADVPVSEIRDLNPALLRGVAPAGIDVRVPKGKSTTVMASLENVPEERRASWRLHRVMNGETLNEIAKQYSTQARSIVAANTGLDSSFFDSPSSGQLLLIPAATPKQPAVTSTSVSKKTRRGSSLTKRAATSSASRGKAKVVRVNTSSTKVAKAAPHRRSVNR